MLVPMEPTTDAPSPGAGADGSGLTRVAIEQALLDSVFLAPEPAVSWYRHEVRRLFLLHLIASVVVVAALVTGAGLAFGRTPIEAAAAGATTGVAVAAVWTLVLVFVLPLTVRQVRRMIAAPTHWVRVRAAPVATTGSPVRADTPDPRAPDPRAPLPDVWDLDPEPEPEPEPDPEPGPGSLGGSDVATATAAETTRPGVALVERCRRAIETAHDLVELGFDPVATLRTDGRPTRMVDLYREGDRVVAAIDRASGDLLVLTELVGLRVLVTTAVPMPPTDELVVNVVAPDTPTALVVAHQRLVAVALSRRTLAGDPIGLFRLADQRRVEGHRGLGPWWAAVLDRRVRTRRPRLSAAPSAGELLLLTGNRVFRDPR
jgi:hypothetical protein